MFFISVLIARSFKGSLETYTYKVEKEYSEALFLGQRVLVDFAGSTVLGFILEIKTETKQDISLLKFCTKFLDKLPVVSKDQFSLFLEFSKLSFLPKIDIFLTIVSPLVNLKAIEKLHLLNKATKTKLPFKGAELTLTKTLKQKHAKEITNLKKQNLVRNYFTVEQSKTKKTRFFSYFEKPLDLDQQSIKYNLIDTTFDLINQVKIAKTNGEKVLLCLKNSINLEYFVNLFSSRVKPEEIIIYSADKLNTNAKVVLFEKAVAKPGFLLIIGFEKVMYQQIDGLKHLILFDDFFESTTDLGISTSEVAKIIANLKGLLVSVFSLVPSFDLVYKTGTKNLNYLADLGEIKQVLVADLFKNSDLSLVSKEVMANLKYNLATCKNTLFLTDHTVYANFVKCADCANVLRCPRCFDYLRYDGVQACYFCQFCSLYLSKEIRCEVCQKSEFLKLSVGAQYFYLYFLEKLNLAKPNDLKILNDFFEKKEIKKTDRIVFSNLENISIDYLKSVKTICVYLPELLFNSKNPYFNHFNYLKLARTLKHAQQAEVYFISESKSPELDTLLVKDYAQFLIREENYRKESALTPFGETYLLFAEGTSLFELFKKLFSFLKTLDVANFLQPEELFKHILNKDTYILKTRLFSKTEIYKYLVEKCAEFMQINTDIKIRLKKEGI